MSEEVLLYIIKQLDTISTYANDDAIIKRIHDLQMNIYEELYPEDFADDIEPEEG